MVEMVSDSATVSFALPYRVKVGISRDLSCSQQNYLSPWLNGMITYEHHYCISLLLLAMRFGFSFFFGCFANFLYTSKTPQLLQPFAVDGVSFGQLYTSITSRQS